MSCEGLHGVIVCRGFIVGRPSVLKRIMKEQEKLNLDDRAEIARYEAFRLCRKLRDKDCKNAEARKFLTRVMRQLKAMDTKEQTG